MTRITENDIEELAIELFEALGYEYIYLWSKYHFTEFISIAKVHAITMSHIKQGDLDEAMVLISTGGVLAAIK